jgi:putative restriction endonuclease
LGNSPFRRDPIWFYPNGLALCSLHHKLFDRGAFSLSETFKIEVSACVNGSVGLKEHLAPFCSNTIIFPSVTAARPNQDFVRWHRTEVFHLPIADVLGIT